MAASRGPRAQLGGLRPVPGDHQAPPGRGRARADVAVDEVVDALGVREARQVQHVPVAGQAPRGEHPVGLVVVPREVRTHVDGRVGHRDPRGALLREPRPVARVQRGGLGDDEVARVLRDREAHVVRQVLRQPD